MKEILAMNPYPDECQYTFKRGDIVQSLCDHFFGEGVEIKKGAIYEIAWAGRKSYDAVQPYNYDAVQLRGLARPLPILASRFEPYDIIGLLMPDNRDYYQAITEENVETNS